jgi:hypothetical protein
MRGLDNLLHHPARPVRAIFLHRVHGSDYLWQAEYRGDKHTPAFTTPMGSRYLVRDAILRGDVRHGLPIIDDDGPAIHAVDEQYSRRRADDPPPGGHAA